MDVPPPTVRKKQLVDSLDDLEFEAFAAQLGCAPAQAQLLNRQIISTRNELQAIENELSAITPRAASRKLTDAFVTCESTHSLGIGFRIALTKTLANHDS